MGFCLSYRLSCSTFVPSSTEQTRRCLKQMFPSAALGLPRLHLVSCTAHSTQSPWVSWYVTHHPWLVRHPSEDKITKMRIAFMVQVWVKISMGPLHRSLGRCFSGKVWLEGGCENLLLPELRARGNITIIFLQMKMVLQWFANVA